MIRYRIVAFQPTMQTEDPRVARSKAAIFDATLELLSEQGFVGTSVDAIAARSGVAKTTIYRHWPTKSELVFDAFESIVRPPTLEPTGSLRDDLITLLSGLARVLNDERLGPLLVSMIEGAEHDTELADLRRRYSRERRQVGRELVVAAIDHGDLLSDTDPDLVLGMLAGTLLYRRMVSGERVGPALVREVVDRVLRAHAARE